MRGRLLAALACLVWLHAAAGSVAGAAVVVDERAIDARTLELTIETPALTERTRVRVLLPNGYAARPHRRYPVVYLLHGALGDYRIWTDVAKIASLTEGFPAIFVMPDGGRSGFYSDWYNDGRFGQPQWERYHVGELVPLIDARYRTVADRASRALLGGSMGGYGAFSYAARHPDLFGAAVSISGALDTNYFASHPIVTSGPIFDLRPPNSVYGPRAMHEVRWRGHNPVDLAGNLQAMDLQIRSHRGTPGPGHLGADMTEMFVHAMSNSMHERLTELGIPHLWADYGPGGHGSVWARRALIDSLAHLRTTLGELPPPPRRFSHTSIEPSFSVSGWHFRADARRALEFLHVADAHRRGVTLTGSGIETVTTFAYFGPKQRVDVTADDGLAQTLRANRRGRLTFAVDLGPPHSEQQFTTASTMAGEGEPGYFARRSVTLTPR